MPYTSSRKFDQFSVNTHQFVSISIQHKQLSENPLLFRTVQELAHKTAERYHTTTITNLFVLLTSRAGNEKVNLEDGGPASEVEVLRLRKKWNAGDRVLLANNLEDALHAAL